MPDGDSAILALVLNAFRSALGVELRSDDDFFEAGGDSVASEAVLLHLEEATGVALPGWTLLDHPTARRASDFLEEQISASR